MILGAVEPAIQFAVQMGLALGLLRRLDSRVLHKPPQPIPALGFLVLHRLLPQNQCPQNLTGFPLGQ